MATAAAGAIAACSSSSSPPPPVSTPATTSASPTTSTSQSAPTFRPAVATITSGQVSREDAPRGATVNWRNGVNERFVTFAPRAGAVPFVIRLAASP